MTCVRIRALPFIFVTNRRLMTFFMFARSWHTQYSDNFLCIYYGTYMKVYLTSNAVHILYIMNTILSPSGKILIPHQHLSKTVVLMIHLLLQHLKSALLKISFRIQHSIPLSPFLHISGSIHFFFLLISTFKTDKFSSFLLSNMSALTTFITNILA